MSARARILMVFCLAAMALVLEGAWAVAAITLVSMGVSLSVAAARGRRGALLVGATILLWSTVLGQALFWAEVPSVVIARVGPLALHREGAIHGFVQGLRLLAVSAAGAALIATTPPHRLVPALSALGVPWSLAFLAASALRFLPETARELWWIRSARAQRGRPAFRRWPHQWIRLEVAMLLPALARVLRRAWALADSLEARGFRPGVAASGPPEPWLRYERVFLVVLVTGTLCATTARVLFWAYTHGFHYAPELRPVYAFVRAWM